MRADCFDLVDTLLAPASTPIARLEAARWLYDAFLQMSGPARMDEQDTDGLFGRALSPAMAAQCLTDVARTRVFLLAVEAQVRRIAVERRTTVRVLYAGCGPFATLVLPLARRLRDVDVVVEAWDAHQASVSAAENLRRALGESSDFIALRQADAMTATLQSFDAPDLVVIETMQQALVREPQVALTARLAARYPHAVFVPERIDLALVGIDLTREFAFDGSPLARLRIPLGWQASVSARALGADRALTDAVAQGREHRLFEQAATVPELPQHARTAAILTRIRAGAGQELGDYDSGLTHPMLLHALGAPVPGQTLACHYLVGPHPGPSIQPA